MKRRKAEFAVLKVVDDTSLEVLLSRQQNTATCEKLIQANSSNLAGSEILIIQIKRRLRVEEETKKVVKLVDIVPPEPQNRAGKGVAKPPKTPRA